MRWFGSRFGCMYPSCMSFKLLKDSISLGQRYVHKLGTRLPWHRDKDCLEVVYKGHPYESYVWKKLVSLRSLIIYGVLKIFVVVWIGLWLDGIEKILWVGMPCCIGGLGVVLEWLATLVLGFFFFMWAVWLCLKETITIASTPWNNVL